MSDRVSLPQDGVNDWFIQFIQFMDQFVDPVTGYLHAEEVERAVVAAGLPSATQWYAFMMSRTMRYREPVANAAALPASGNLDGDYRQALDTGFFHVWAEGSWTDLGAFLQGPQGPVGPQGEPGDLTQGIADTLYTPLSHAGLTTNPHAVTKAQVGLSNVPNTDATVRANHTGTQAISTVTGLQAALDAKAASGDYFQWNVRNYGAVQDGTTNDLTAVQACVNAYVAAGCVGRITFDRNMAINGAISVSDVSNVIVGFTFLGPGKGAFLKQLASNTPIFTVNGSDLHSWTIGNFRATWNGTTTSAHTASVVLHLGAGTSNKSFYNNLLVSLVVDNGYRFIDTAGMLFWGNRIIDVNISNMKGGVWSLTGTAGQPINTVVGFYVNATGMTTTLFTGNALVVTFTGLEINQNPGLQLFFDAGGGAYRFVGETSVEGGTYATTRRLFELPDCKVDIDTLKIEGDVVNVTVTVFRTEGTGRIRVHEEWRDGLVPKSTAGGTAMTGTGFVCMSSVGGALSDPSTRSEHHVDVADVTFYGTGNTGWIRTGPYVQPTDMGGSASADSTVIRSWVDRTRFAYSGDANYTFTLGGPMAVVYTTATATRSAQMPHNDFMFSGMEYVVVNNTAQTVNITNSGGGTELATPTAVIRHALYNRSLTGGPSLGWSKGA